MYSGYASLEVKPPDGEKYDFSLAGKYRFTVGRSNGNDIVLPNPEKTISRQHCVLECEANCWWVVDECSANGTFVQQCNSDTRIDVRQNGRLQLKNEDVILILGKFLQPEEPVFWKLTFLDIEQTKPVPKYQPHPYLEYSLSLQKLCRVNGRDRQKINLTPRERKLIHYMAELNQANNNQPTVCNYQYLIARIWDDEIGHTNNDVTRLIWSLRRKIELDSGEPEFLRTEQGQGYSLKVKLLA